MGTFCAGGGAPGGDKWRAGGAGKNQTSATMRTAAMDQLALSLIVGGAALICSGLVFLLPLGRKRLTHRETVEESRARVDLHLQEMRRRQGDLS